MIIAIVNLHIFPSFNININFKVLPKEYFIEHFPVKGHIQKKLFNVGSREYGVQFSIFSSQFYKYFLGRDRGFPANDPPDPPLILFAYT